MRYLETDEGNTERVCSHTHTQAGIVVVEITVLQEIQSEAVRFNKADQNKLIAPPYTHTHKHTHR